MNGAVEELTVAGTKALATSLFILQLPRWINEERFDLMYVKQVERADEPH